MLARAAEVSVHVTGPHDTPIPSAIISLISRNGAQNRSLSTDANGSCRFIGVPAGQYFAAGEAPGFDASAPQSIEVKSEGLAEVALWLGLAQVRSSVVVTASGTPQSTDEVSKALTVVSSDTIDLRADRSLAEALLDVPGLRVQQLGGPGSLVVLAGRDVDLGFSAGITTVGATVNPSLPDTGADISVIAGYGPGLHADNLLTKVVDKSDDYKKALELDPTFTMAAEELKRFSVGGQMMRERS